MITTHDGFTLYDLVTYNEKRNLCGVLNPICCDDPFSSWCDKISGEDNNRSRNWSCDALTGYGKPFCEALYPHCGWGRCDGWGCDKNKDQGSCEGQGGCSWKQECVYRSTVYYSEPLKRQLMRNFFMAMLLSHGTPMLLGGDEWLRTQFGNNNAYSGSADNHWNWLAWGSWTPRPERARMHDFVRKLIRFRKEHAYALSPASFATRAPHAWKDEGNNTMDGADWGSRHFMLHYYDSAVGPELVILLNMEQGDVTYTLPSGRTWYRIADTQAFFDMEDNFVPTQDPKASANIELDTPQKLDLPTYTAKQRSIVILEARP
jgi:glycogen operon protein